MTVICSVSISSVIIALVAHRVAVCAVGACLSCQLSLSHPHGWPQDGSRAKFRRAASVVCFAVSAMMILLDRILVCMSAK
jgi:hypothetical protein